MQIFSELKETSPSTSSNPQTKKASFGTVYFSTEVKNYFHCFFFFFLSTEKEFFHRSTLEILFRVLHLLKE